MHLIVVQKYVGSNPIDNLMLFNILLILDPLEQFEIFVVLKQNKNIILANTDFFL